MPSGALQSQSPSRSLDGAKSRRSAAQSSEEQQPAAPAAITALAADAAQQAEASRSGSSVSSTLDSLDALLSSGSIDAQEDEPGAEHRPSSPPARLRPTEAMWTFLYRRCGAQLHSPLQCAIRRVNDESVGAASDHCVCDCCGSPPETCAGGPHLTAASDAGDAGASADALRAEWWAQPVTNQTAEPRTAATEGGAAGPMLNPHGLLDNLWGGRPSGKLTEVGSGEYDVPQVSPKSGAKAHVAPNIVK